jgi:hypothetical protein
MNKWQYVGFGEPPTQHLHFCQWVSEVSAEVRQRLMQQPRPTPWQVCCMLDKLLGGWKDDYTK